MGNSTLTRKVFESLDDNSLIDILRKGIMLIYLPDLLSYLEQMQEPLHLRLRICQAMRC